MLRNASSLICGPWMPRVEVSSTCGGSTPGAVSVSVPVVSAWTHFSFGAAAISVARDVMAEADDDVDVGDHALGFVRVVDGMKFDGRKALRQPLAVLLRV